MSENDQIERNFRITNNNAVDMHAGNGSACAEHCWE